MEIRRASLSDCASVGGMVVVIDVLRAFSTAAYALAAGAREILLAGTVEQAFELRKQFPDYLIMGEVDGLKLKGFDLGNSPSELKRLDLSDRGLIHRTSAGTQGIVLSRRAEVLFAASFVVARYTARVLRYLAPRSLTFIITGYGSGGYGDEDIACADYIEAMMNGNDVDPEPFIRRVRESHEGRIFADPARPEFPASDLEYCVAHDRFNFALQIERREGLLIMNDVI